MRLRIINAGLPMDLDVPDEEMARVHRPLIERLVSASRRERVVALVAGAPGSGKSTLCGIWQALADGDGVDLRTVSLDGFHLPNAVLRERGLLSRKGAPETFDLAAATRMLERVKAGEAVTWPVYDRTCHEPVADGTALSTERIVVVEGNYLLLDRPGWRRLREGAALTVMIRPDLKALRERVVARHMRGGMDRPAAERKFDESDWHNILLVERESLPADVTLLQSADGRYTVKT